jgi:protein-disulfide isomerase
VKNLWEFAGFRRFFRPSWITQISSTGDRETRVAQGAAHLALAFESCQNRRSILGGKAASARLGAAPAATIVMELSLRNVLIAGVVVVVAGIAGFLAWQHYQTSAPAASPGQAPADLKPIDSPLAKQQPDDMVMGDANAPITMIEYSSLSCPHCARFQKDVLPKIKTDFIDTGKVKFIPRDFPLNKPAVQAAQFAHCAGPMRFFALEDALFKTQDQWLTENAVEALANIAATAGMDRPTFDACLANKDIEAKIVASRKSGEDAFQINATPTFIINGVKLEGEQSYDDLKALFAKLSPSGS